MCNSIQSGNNHAKKRHQESQIDAGGAVWGEGEGNTPIGRGGGWGWGLWKKVGGGMKRWGRVEIWKSSGCGCKHTGDMMVQGKHTCTRRRYAVLQVH